MQYARWNGICFQWNSFCMGMSGVGCMETVRRLLLVIRATIYRLMMLKSFGIESFRLKVIQCIFKSFWGTENAGKGNAEKVEN